MRPLTFKDKKVRKEGKLVLDHINVLKDNFPFATIGLSLISKGVDIKIGDTLFKMIDSPTYEEGIEAAKKWLVQMNDELEVEVDKEFDLLEKELSRYHF